MATPLDISTFVYQTGTLNITPGDTTAVFSGASLASSVKDGDYLFAGGSLAVIQTVTDDTHVDLFTEWAGAGVSAGPYLILKASLLRYHTALIGYDSASFLAMLDGTAVWYAVEGAAPDPSIGEDGNRALKSNVTPWVVWLKTGGVWVEQAGSPGGPGATILVQNAEPDTSHPDNSLWIDSDSADLDVYALTGSPLAWADTGMNLKGATGPASLKPIEAWVTATAYVTGPPASFVSQAGSAYECLIPHTSGTFNTDLAAGKWGLVAAKGADGTGVGDVVGPASAVDSNLALFDGATGKLLKDDGVAVSSFATAAQGAKADSAVQDVAAVTHAATGKTTPVDADELPLVDSEASNGLKKLTWTNLKSILLATFTGDSGSGGAKGLVPAPAAGDAAAGKFLKADGSWSAPSGGLSILMNYISGLTLSTSGSSATFSIAKGIAADSSGAAMMSLASAYTKTTSPWAVGSGNGALDTGTIANSTWYHVWLIQRSDTSVVDVLISTSATAPTMPTSYDRKRRIGSMKTNGSAQWTSFIQDGDNFLWSVPVFETTPAISTTAVLMSLSVPGGIKCYAILELSYFINTPQSAILITSPDQVDSAPVTNGLMTMESNNTIVASSIEKLTNTSGQIRIRSTAASGNQLFVTTQGWVDRRDK